MIIFIFSYSFFLLLGLSNILVWENWFKALYCVTLGTSALPINCNTCIQKLNVFLEYLPGTKVELLWDAIESTSHALWAEGTTLGRKTHFLSGPLAICSLCMQKFLLVGKTIRNTEIYFTLSIKHRHTLPL